MYLKKQSIRRHPVAEMTTESEEKPFLTVRAALCLRDGYTTHFGCLYVCLCPRHNSQALRVAVSKIKAGTCAHRSAPGVQRARVFS